MIELFLRLIAAHLCGDLLSYSRLLARMKRSKRHLKKLGGLGVHCLVHALFVWLWLWGMPWPLKAWASIYIFATHFLIDVVRINVEPLLIDKSQFVILRRKDVFRYFMGKGEAKSDAFLSRHFKKWSLVNAGDQLLHVSAIGIFALCLIDASGL